MVIVDQAIPPAGVVDRLLWQDAQGMLARHSGAGHDGDCVWCGWRWPCAPRRIAERADTASRRPWREAWTFRHDLNSVREMPGLLDDVRPAPRTTSGAVPRTTGRPADRRAERAARGTVVGGGERDAGRSGKASGLDAGGEI